MESVCVCKVELDKPETSSWYGFKDFCKYSISASFSESGAEKIVLNISTLHENIKPWCWVN